MQIEEEFHKISCVQLNLENSKNFDEFYNLIDVGFNISNLDLIVFPENINLSLIFAREIKINSLDFRSTYEKIIDKLLSWLDLSFILRFQNLDVQKNIILNSFTALAKKYNSNIITGSFYEKKEDGIYNVIYAIDRNGEVIGSSCKKDLVGFEKALGIKSKAENKVVDFDFGKVGLSVCFDLNDKEYCSKFNCDILVGPSNGFRPLPGYPFDKFKETPQIQRAIENNYAVIRPYCAGWFGPLYFSGRSMIVGKDGMVLAESKTRNQTELLIVDIIS